MSSVTEEGKQETLPVNHPAAGYVEPAKDTLVDTGTVPDPEQEAWDERIAANEAQAKAVADAEHEAATKPPETEEPPPEPEQQSSKTSTSKSSSSSSASS